MKRLLLYGFVATLLFTVSASLSLWMQGWKFPAEEAGKAAKTPPRKAAEPGAKSPGDAAPAPAEDLRPAVRPNSLPASEEAVQLANSLRDRIKAVREREEQLNARQKQLELVYQDIRGERTVLDEMRKQVNDELKALTEKLSAVERRFGDLEQEKQTVSKSVADLQKRQIDLDGVERKNIDKMASMYDSMAPESAARILQQMADSGKMDTAVKLLGQMKERQAAKVLAEIPDATLAAQLLEKLRGLKRSAPAAVPAPPAAGNP